MVEGVQREAESERLACFVCAQPSASVFAFSAAEMPPGSGLISGLAVCARCMNRMTHNALNAWDEEAGHSYTP